MIVELLNYTISEELISKEHIANAAAAVCVGKYDSMYKNEKLDTRHLTAAVKSGHLSVLEHLSISFLIQGISRACSHQLVRHRIASYSQKSQRYSKIKTDFVNKRLEEWYVIPQSIRDKGNKEQEYFIASTAFSNPLSSEWGNKTTCGKYRVLMDKIAEFYQLLLDEGIPAEDARFILPNACKTDIIVTMNVRAFVEACKKRICGKAQWEIRELFTTMREKIKDIYPTGYKLAVPNCYTEVGCQEKVPCEKQFA